MTCHFYLTRGSRRRVTLRHFFMTTWQAWQPLVSSPTWRRTSSPTSVLRATSPTRPLSPMTREMERERPWTRSQTARRVRLQRADTSVSLSIDPTAPITPSPVTTPQAPRSLSTTQTVSRPTSPVPWMTTPGCLPLCELAPLPRPEEESPESIGDAFTTSTAQPPSLARENERRLFRTSSASSAPSPQLQSPLSESGYSNLDLLAAQACMLSRIESTSSSTPCDM